MLKPQLINALKEEMGYDNYRPRCKDCNYCVEHVDNNLILECHYNNIGVITDIDPQAVCDKFNRKTPVAPTMPHEYDPTVNMRTK